LSYKIVAEKDGKTVTTKSKLTHRSGKPFRLTADLKKANGVMTAHRTNY
jgi:hypothetical protein